MSEEKAILAGNLVKDILLNTIKSLQTKVAELQEQVDLQFPSVIRVAQAEKIAEQAALIEKLASALKQCKEPLIYGGNCKQDALNAVEEWRKKCLTS